ncbi:AMP-binding protein [Plantactinospora sp. CA-290183]|uniref:AMP-binding protein n=1 Tax=Plantactinospora sp. CA-290183 TaxID=3240006 RepID=UPI003D8BF0E4
MLPTIAEHRCTSFPGDLMITDDAGDHTAGQIQVQAKALSKALAEHGVRTGARVALALPAGADMLTAMLALWRTGASFVPVDPREPADRFDEILRACSATAVLAASEPRTDLPGPGRSWLRLNAGSVDGPICRAVTTHAGDEAYVLFTSGSAGSPKGVPVSHANLSYYLDSIQAAYGVPRTGMLVPTQLPPTFDAALTTLLMPLVTRNPGISAVGTQDLAELLRRSGRPVLAKTTPSQLRILSGLLTREQWQRVEGILIVGGEALDYTDLEEVRRHSRLTVHNEYGPTETTVACSAHEVHPGDPWSGPVPIGRPFPATTFTLRPGPVDTGDTGELVITGPGVASDYLNADAAAFTGAGPGPRSYRTGDRVRRTGDGNYVFLGRYDDQVKVNGYRVELGEIDAALRTVTQSPAAAVLADGALIAVVQQRSELNLDKAREHLRRLLPAHLQPADWQSRATLPLTAHGKVDRKTLTDQLIERTSESRIGALSGSPNGSATGRAALAGLWRELLGDDVGDDTDFFAAGASSITALVMTGRAGDLIGAELAVSLIFDKPVFADFAAAALAGDGTGTPVPDCTGTRESPSTTQTPSAAQLNILAAEGWQPGNAAYTTVAAARFTLPSIGALIEALRETVARTEILRWRFGLDEQYQIVAQVGDVPAVTVTDLRRMDPAAADQTVAARLAEHRDRSIDVLSGAPLAEIRLWHTMDDDAGQRGVCALVAHHVVTDEASVALLWNRALDRVRTGGPVRVDRYYARWAPTTVTDAARRAAVDDAAIVAWALTSESLSRLRDGDPRAGAGSFIRLLPDSGDISGTARRMSLPAAAILSAAAAAALAEDMTGTRFAVHVPVTRRRTGADTDAAGCFVSSLPVPADVPDDPGPGWVRTWHRLLVDVAGRAGADPAAVATLLRAADPSAVAFQVSLVVETPFAVHQGSIRWQPHPVAPGPAKHDLAIFCGRDPLTGSVTVRIDWRAGVYDDSRAAELAGRISKTLRRLIDQDQAAEPPAAAVTADAVAEIASAVLGRRVGPADDLFATGAQSIDLLRLCAAVRARLGKDITLLDIFDKPSAEQLANLVSDRFDSRKEPA